MIVTVLAAKVVLPTRPLIYAFPLPAVAMLIATLIDGAWRSSSRRSWACWLASSMGSPFEAATLALVSGVVAACCLAPRAAPGLLRGRLLVALAQIAVVVAFQLAQRGEDVQQLMIAAFCVVNGLVSAMLAVGATYVLGRFSASPPRCSSWSSPIRPSRSCDGS